MMNMGKFTLFFKILENFVKSVIEDNFVEIGYTQRNSVPLHFEKIRGNIATMLPPQYFNAFSAKIYPNKARPG